jgi:hypothetical protein
MTLTKELINLGCILIIDKNPKKGNPLSTTYFRAKIIHSSQTFYITSRLGTISEYHIAYKGFDTNYQVCKYILNTIKGE